MEAFGILSCAAYAPRKRISRAAILDAVGWAQPSLKNYAKGARAFGAWDEDAITMATAAARHAAKTNSVNLDALCFASTTAPFLDRQNAGVIAAAMDLDETVHVFDAAGSQRAASSALITAAKAAAQNTLIAAADRTPTTSASVQEMLYGDGASAIVIGKGDPIATIVGVNAVRGDIVDHYRTEQSETNYALEERWYRDEGLARLAPAAAKPLLASNSLKSADIDYLIAPVANPSLAKAVAKALEIDPQKLANGHFADTGFTGVAHAFFQLETVLMDARPGAVILMTVFGQGCDAILLRTTDKLQDYQQDHQPAGAGHSIIEENYTRFLSSSGALKLDWGMRAERDNRTAQTVAFNKNRDIYGFVGGICAKCGTPQFPKARRCVNPECNALDSQTDYRFADRKAVVKTFTEDWLAFTREPPLVYGNVSFEGGGNVFMEMTGFASGETAVGAPVEMEFRIKDIDDLRGFKRYFWKAAPSHGAHHG